MFIIRDMVVDDVEAIAGIHTQSWQSAYRGILLDSYLDGSLCDEHLTIWQERLSKPVAEHIGLVALSGSSIVGFAFAFVDHDKRWGTLLDNLHVHPECQGQGIGTKLLIGLTNSLLQRTPQGGIYLEVFEENHRARRYYEKLGAEVIERSVADAPGGGKVAEWLYAWPLVEQLNTVLRNQN
ncbi:MAG: N-acetyltransferase [Chloroflexota bacterium]